MTSRWPKEAIDFEAFLAAAGLQLRRREDGASFGDKISEYCNSTICVRMVSDRSIWSIEVSDPMSQSGEWYDAALIRDMFGTHGDDVLALTEQIRIIETNWGKISGLFSVAQRANSHAQLLVLRQVRSTRRFRRS